MESGERLYVRIKKTGQKKYPARFRFVSEMFEKLLVGEAGYTRQLLAFEILQAGTAARRDV